MRRSRIRALALLAILFALSPVHAQSTEPTKAANAEAKPPAFKAHVLSRDTPITRQACDTLRSSSAKFKSPILCLMML